MPGIGLGKVQLSVTVKGRTKDIVLVDVLHVPKLKKNLISVTKLQDRGIVVETTAPPIKKTLVIRHQGCTVGVASQIEDTFILDRPANSAFPVEKVTDRNRRELRSVRTEYNRWHHQFGHIGPQIIKKVHTVVDDIKQAVKPTKDQPNYKIYALTKKVRVVNRASPKRSTQPLARVFSDFWGPYNVPAITRKTYMLTFTDDYTRKS